jgi:hypothetical protein
MARARRLRLAGVVLAGAGMITLGGYDCWLREPSLDEVPPQRRHPD